MRVLKSLPPVATPVALLLLAPRTLFAAGINTALIGQYSNGIINLVNDVFVPVLMAVAFVVFIWGIFKYFIYGAANESEKADGRKFALWGIIGFIIILSLWGIVNLLMSALGLTAANAPLAPTLGASETTGGSTYNNVNLILNNQSLGGGTNSGFANSGNTVGSGNVSAGGVPDGVSTAANSSASSIPTFFNEQIIAAPSDGFPSKQVVQNVLSPVVKQALSYAKGFQSACELGLDTVRLRSFSNQNEEAFMVFKNANSVPFVTNITVSATPTSVTIDPALVQQIHGIDSHAIFVDTHPGLTPSAGPDVPSVHDYEMLCNANLAGITQVSIDGNKVWEFRLTNPNAGCPLNATKLATAVFLQVLATLPADQRQSAGTQYINANYPNSQYSLMHAKLLQILDAVQGATARDIESTAESLLSNIGVTVLDTSSAGVCSREYAVGASTVGQGLANADWKRTLLASVNWGPIFGRVNGDQNGSGDWGFGDVSGFAQDMLGESFTPALDALGPTDQGSPSADVGASDQNSGTSGGTGAPEGINVPDGGGGQSLDPTVAAQDTSSAEANPPSTDQNAGSNPPAEENPPSDVQEPIPPNERPPYEQCVLALAGIGDMAANNRANNSNEENTWVLAHDPSGTTVFNNTIPGSNVSENGFNTVLLDTDIIQALKVVVGPNNVWSIHIHPAVGFPNGIGPSSIDVMNLCADWGRGISHVVVDGVGNVYVMDVPNSQVICSVDSSVAEAYNALQHLREEPVDDNLPVSADLIISEMLKNDPNSPYVPLIESFVGKSSDEIKKGMLYMLSGTGVRLIETTPEALCNQQSSAGP